MRFAAIYFFLVNIFYALVFCRRATKNWISRNLNKHKCDLFSSIKTFCGVLFEGRFVSHLGKEGERKEKEDEIIRERKEG